MIRMLSGIAVVIILAASGYIYQYGKPRIVREAAVFSEALKACAPLEQDYWVAPLRKTMKRVVIGTNDGLCGVTMEALGGEALRCDLPTESAEILADGIMAGLKDVDIFGRPTAYRFSSENPDPMTVVMNGPHCGG